MARPSKRARAGRTVRRGKGAVRAPEAPNPITVYGAWCKRCGICVAFCPANVLEPGPDGTPAAARPEDCIRCHLCELRCPDFAISVAGKQEGEP